LRRPNTVTVPKVSLRYRVFCCDYDGTLASEGLVPAPALTSLQELKVAGWKLVMVTGRLLHDLRKVFGRLDLFDRVVLENGGVLYRPEDGSETALGAPPPPAFVEVLRRRGVSPLEAGRVIVATRVPYETAVLETIRRLGLELQIIFNKGAVMVLPPGVNKHSGVAAALEELGLSFHDAVGVGDAENDLAFLRDCELSVAVANALQSVIERSHLVTAAARSEGVVELAHLLLRADERDRERQRRLERWSSLSF
jgi:hydroxymethylpyrimidine pyrophosphatase-like HAD family hydrolase